MEGSQVVSGRLSVAPSTTFIDTVVAPLLEEEAGRFHYYCWIDQAHTVMLHEAGILRRESAKKILTTLLRLQMNGVQALNLDPAAGSFLFQIESYLARHVGEEIAGSLHTARGRADYQSASLTLLARDVIIELAEQLIRFEQEIINLASRHVNTLMPAYTHLQQAQPSTFGHYILSHIYPLERDFSRLTGLYRRSDLSTLGCCSRVGTSWPIDRHRVSRLLGHEGLVLNAQDQTYYRREHLGEFAAVASLLANNLARLATDLELWSSAEFSLVELPDSHCGSSSIMPQKKNPYSLERCRAVAGESIGWLASVLGVYKMSDTSAGDPTFSVLSEGRLLADVRRHVGGMLRLFTELLPRMEVHEDRMAEMTRNKWNTATQLSDAIAQKTGLPFRHAHHVVGAVVRRCIDNDILPSGVTAELVDEVASSVLGKPIGMSNDVIREAMDAWECIASLRGIGSANPVVVERAAADAADRVREQIEWLTTRQARIQDARDELARAVAAICAPDFTAEVGTSG